MFGPERQRRGGEVVEDLTEVDESACAPSTPAAVSDGLRTHELRRRRGIGCVGLDRQRPPVLLHDTRELQTTEGVGEAPEELVPDLELRGFADEVDAQHVLDRLRAGLGALEEKTLPAVAKRDTTVAVSHPAVRGVLDLVGLGEQ